VLTKCIEALDANGEEEDKQKLMDKMSMLRLIGFGTVGFAAVNLFSVTFNMIEDGLLSVISDFWCNLAKSLFMLVILWACRPIKG